VKNDRYLRGLYARPAPRRATSQLRAPLLIAAGLLGVPLAMSLAGHVFDNDEDDAPSAVSASTAYPMNHFLPGAGYYHAPYHAWFPMPFNFRDPARGWYRGGQWRSAERESDAERAEEQRTSGFASSGGRTGGAARVMTSRPTPDAAQRANASAASHSANVIRGGFGSSSHPAIS
jgi:hypothetical protein